MGALGPPQLPITLPFLVLFAIALALGAAIGLVAGAGRWGQRLGVVLAFATLPLPLLGSMEQPLLRFILGLASVLAMLRALDFLRGVGLGTAGARVWFALTPVDVRQTTRVAPGLDLSRLRALLGYGALAAATLLALARVAPLVPGSPGLALRWLLGLVFSYAVIDTVCALFHVAYRVVGVALPDFHRAPILSTSLQEFWGVRWNRPVHEWLARHCFMPLARRRQPLAGVAAAFLASTVIHVWLAFVCVPLLLTVAMGAFFLLHGALVVLERALAVARWRSPLGRVWTVLCFALTGPLFAASMLRALSL